MRGTGGRKSLPLEGASIAFVWTPAEAGAQTNTAGRAEARTHFRKREDDMQKDKKFSIRISESDLETIKQKAKQANLSQGEYVTRCCLGRQVVVIDGLKEVAKELRSVGNNLNQLAVLANMGRIQTVDLKSTAQELAVISATVRDIQERRRWDISPSSIL